MLTIGVGGDASSLRSGARSITVDCQYSNCVLCELIESVHLVVESGHLHTLKTNVETTRHSITLGEFMALWTLCLTPTVSKL